MRSRRSDLVALRSLPGVKNATTTNQVPFNNSSWNSSINLTKEQTHQNLNATVYMGDVQFLDTMGLKLVAGRNFTADDIVAWEELDKPNSKVQPHVAIMSQATADKLWPGENPIGKQYYSWGDDPTRVVGIVEHMVRPNNNGGFGAFEYSHAAAGAHALHRRRQLPDARRRSVATRRRRSMRRKRC